jgi:hypothetical protein
MPQDLTLAEQETKENIQRLRGWAEDKENQPAKLASHALVLMVKPEEHQGSPFGAAWAGATRL